jgi:hypothetical protein
LPSLVGESQDQPEQPACRHRTPAPPDRCRPLPRTSTAGWGATSPCRPCTRSAYATSVGRPARQPCEVEREAVSPLSAGIGFLRGFVGSPWELKAPTCVDYKSEGRRFESCRARPSKLHKRGASRCKLDAALPTSSTDRCLRSITHLSSGEIPP